jgi:predicted RNase H-like HicB family nuclease
MKRPFAATVWREGKWYVSQCLEIDVASQGETEEEALGNLREALELHFEPPQATRLPKIRTLEVEVGAA